MFVLKMWSWVSLTMALFLCLTLTYITEAKEAILIGTVYCDTCFQQHFSPFSHFISGALVAVECGGGGGDEFQASGGKSGFRDEVKTDVKGEFRVILPFSPVKHVDEIKRCSVKLIRSSDPDCAVAAISTASSSSIRVKVKTQENYVFSTGFFTFQPLEQPKRCQWESHANSNDETIASTPLSSPVVDEMLAPVPSITDQNPIGIELHDIADENNFGSSYPLNHILPPLLVPSFPSQSPPDSRLNTGFQQPPDSKPNTGFQQPPDSMFFPKVRSSPDSKLNTGFQPPPDSMLPNTGFQTPPDSMLNTGFQPPPSDSMPNTGFQPPSDSMPNTGFQPSPSDSMPNTGFQPPPDSMLNSGFQPPPNSMPNTGFQPSPLDSMFNNTNFQSPPPDSMFNPIPLQPPPDSTFDPSQPSSPSLTPQLLTPPPPLSPSLPFPPQPDLIQATPPPPPPINPSFPAFPFQPSAGLPRMPPETRKPPLLYK